MACPHLVNRILLLTNVQWIQRFWRIVGYREVPLSSALFRSVKVPLALK
jgi:hypothetical protein